MDRLSCPVPGCGRILRGDNTSGYCREHYNKLGRAGRAGGVIAPPNPPRHPDRKTVKVSRISTHSGHNPTVEVTMPRAPWEAKA